MTELLTNKDNLSKYGFCVVRNLLDSKEIDEFRSTIQKIHEQNNNPSVTDLHNYSDTWKFFTNERLINILKNLIGSDIYYLHNCSSLHSDFIPTAQSWHRDNPCRTVGKGPDWDENDPYNVLTVIIYLSPYNKTRSGLTLIPSSHKKSYVRTISNILRIFHYRTKNIKFLKKFREKIQNYIGVTLRTDPGDCVIFFANLLHQGLPTNGLRQALLAQFGPTGKHSKNFVNYCLNYRKYIKYDLTKKENKEFFSLLKEKKIYHPIPDKKEEIEGASIPRQ